MERKTAVAKLARILGKRFGYRVDPKAPNLEGRDEARAKVKETGPKLHALRMARDARMKELLQADAEYQRLCNEYKVVLKEYETALSLTNHYRFTVGVCPGSSPFFIIKAQADTWEEIFDKLSKKKAA
jgi:hypothetical protein